MMRNNWRERKNEDERLVQDVIDDDDVDSAVSFVGLYPTSRVGSSWYSSHAVVDAGFDTLRNMFTVPTSNSQSSTNSMSTHVIVSTCTHISDIYTKCFFIDRNMT